MADNFPYQVSWLPTPKTIVRDLIQNSPSSTARDKLLHGIRTLDDLLRSDPLAVGKVDWVAGAIERRNVIIGFLLVNFSVDRQRQFVVVTRCEALWRGNGWVPD